MGLPPPDFSDWFFPEGKNDRVLKWHTLKSGKKIMCHGYEGYAIDELLKDHAEEDIKIDECHVPIIEYKNYRGKNKFWSPEVYIPKENKVLEVLPIWTHYRSPDRSYLRSNAATLQGLTYDLWIYDSKGRRLETPKTLPSSPLVCLQEPLPILFPATQEQNLQFPPSEDLKSTQDASLQ